MQINQRKSSGPHPNRKIIDSDLASLDTVREHEGRFMIYLPDASVEGTSYILECTRAELERFLARKDFHPFHERDLKRDEKRKAYFNMGWNPHEDP